MKDTLVEKMVQASSYIGDFIMSARSSFNKIFHDVTIGSIPERSKKSRKDTESETKLLHDIEMGRGHED